MKRLTCGVLLLLAGTASADPCIPTVDDEHGSVRDARLEGGALAFCADVEGTPSTCWSVELATGKYSASAPPLGATSQAANPPATANVAVDGVEVCAAAGAPCGRVALKLPKGQSISGLAVDDRGALLAVVASSSDGAKVSTHGAVQIYDVATGKLRATIPAWRPTREKEVGYVVSAGFFGDLIEVQLSDGSDASPARIFDAGGKLIADLLEPVGQNSPFRLDADRWGFDAYNGSELTIVDGTHHKLLKRFALKELAPGGLWSPIAAVVPMADDRVAVLLGGNVGKFFGDVMVLSMKSAKKLHFTPPRCPAK